MIKKLLLIFFSISSLGIFSTQIQAATLNVDAGGNLLGASNIDIFGTLYDVEFVEGSCVSIFEGCDSPTGFVFGDLASATQASLALLDQVFLGVFDTNPSLTFGCDNVILNICGIATPYDVSVSSLQVASSVSINSASVIGDGVGTAFLDSSFDFTGADQAVYARWALLNPIPLPAAIWLFGTALVGLVGFSKRRKAA